MPGSATLADQASWYGPAEVVLRDGRRWLLRPGRYDLGFAAKPVEYQRADQ